MTFLAGPVVSQTRACCAWLRGQGIDVCVWRRAVTTRVAFTTRRPRNAHLSMPGAIAASSHVAQLAAQTRDSALALSPSGPPPPAEASRQRAALHYEIRSCSLRGEHCCRRMFISVSFAWLLFLFLCDPAPVLIPWLGSCASLRGRRLVLQSKQDAEEHAPLHERCLHRAFHD